MLIKQMTVGAMAVCCYVIGCEETKKGAIIDPGGNENDILDTCKKEGLDIEYIICTHGHPDHVCGNGKIKDATGAAIVMHEDDATFFGRKEIVDYFSMLGLAASPSPDKLVKDGDSITFGNETLKVIHTPGHTPGGICLYDSPNLFAGDTLFAGGVGRTDFPGGDTNQMLKSIKERLLTLPPDTIVWPGHGYGGLQSTIAAEKSSNPFLTGGW